MKNLKVIVTTLMIGISVIGMSASFSFRKNINKKKLLLQSLHQL